MQELNGKINELENQFDNYSENNLTQDQVISTINSALTPVLELFNEHKTIIQSETA